ncbi:adenylosuccinate synthase [bacterium A37T11]|nr:adenylosuccinate synthase [bacterium A37T11]
MARCAIVVDLGFGDAGKGLTTDYLASLHPDESVVIRFSGGHQVGHTVCTDTFQHTFSNFGSGTLRGVPTYYSEYTSIFPPAIALEAEDLTAFDPRLIFHPLAMLTTAYDVAYNRATEKLNKHGSCGLGFGATIERNKDDVFFFANDLDWDWMVTQRLNSIALYYEQKIQKLGSPDLLAYYMEELMGYDDADYKRHCQKIRSLYVIKKLEQLVPEFQHFIFEGSQGILLDTRHGIYPHTTWSATTSEHALTIIRSCWKVDLPEVTLYYVTRCYQTRHGNGPMSSVHPVSLIGAAAETNVENEFQGVFRTAALDPQLLAYALKSDDIYHDNFAISKNLVITCLDQLPNFYAEDLLTRLPVSFKTVYGSYGPRATDIRQIYP